MADGSRSKLWSGCTPHARQWWCGGYERRDQTRQWRDAAPGRHARSGTHPIAGGERARDANPQQNFRFYDNRQKYLMFVNTCSEKWVVANRINHGTRQHPSTSAGDPGVRRGRGRRHRAVAGDALDAQPLPLHAVHVVGKEISLEDVRLALEGCPTASWSTRPRCS